MSDASGFDHGTRLTAWEGHVHVHDPRWWNLGAHLLWMIAVVERRTGSLTFSDGSKLRVVWRRR